MKLTDIHTKMHELVSAAYSLGYDVAMEEVQGWGKKLLTQREQPVQRKYEAINARTRLLEYLTPELGLRTPKEIANSIGLVDYNSVYPYLSTLVYEGLLEKVKPPTSNQTTYRRIK